MLYIVPPGLILQLEVWTFWPPSKVMSWVLSTAPQLGTHKEYKSCHLHSLMCPKVGFLLSSSRNVCKWLFLSLSPLQNTFKLIQFTKLNKVKSILSAKLLGHFKGILFIVDLQEIRRVTDYGIFDTSDLGTHVERVCVCVCVCVCVHAQLCPTLCNSMDSSPPGSAVHGIFQARILAICSSRRSSPPREWTHVSCTGRRVVYHCATWEDPDLRAGVES